MQHQKKKIKVLALVVTSDRAVVHTRTISTHRNAVGFTAAGVAFVCASLQHPTALPLRHKMSFVRFMACDHQHLLHTRTAQLTTHSPHSVPASEALSIRR